jgi:single-strand DNA-binding protein
MAGSLNKVSLIGNVGKDPEIRSTQEGKEIITFSLATTDTWKSKVDGEQRKKTEWHRIVVFNSGLVEVIKRYVTKGSKLYIEGSLQTREWNDQSSVKKYTTEIVLQTYNSVVILLGGKNYQDSGSSDESEYSQKDRMEYSGIRKNPAEKDDDDIDDVPF